MASDHSFSANRAPQLPPQGISLPLEIEVPRPILKRLPNARVGREFSAVLTEHLPDSEPEAACSNFPPGLICTAGILHGIPELAGDFEITVGNEVLALMVHADPRSLWKDLPSDREDPFWKQDAVSEFLAAGPLTVVGASLRGRSHAHVGSFRDDDLALAWFPVSGWYSLTVADGAGSAKFSRQGSKIVCETVKSYFSNYFAATDNVLSQTSVVAAELHTELCLQFGNVAKLARQQIAEEAARLEVGVRDFHTTLISVLLHPLPDGQWFVAAFSVGDGAAALVAVPGGEPCLLTCPDAGEYAGQTVFLTMDEVLSTPESVAARIRTAVVPSFQALLLVTDGVSDPHFESESALADPAAWAVLWQELTIQLATADSPSTAATSILKWLEFHSPGHHDDRTLVLAALSLTFATP